MSYNTVFQFILSPKFPGWLIAVKIIFIIISLLLIGFIIFALFKTLWLKRMWLWDLEEFMTFRPYGVRKIVKEWLKIKARLDTGLESEYKLCVIEADSMLDDIFKGMGVMGASLGERLEKMTAASLPNIEQARLAHTTRNNIVHDPNYRLSLDEAKKTVEIFEKSLIDLQAL
ncbi:MAG: hypothetical protein Q7S70_01840 [bacterium]|nr:hypothetical protein [bacterium]